jgi:hypothetical protein
MAALMLIGLLSGALMVGLVAAVIYGVIYRKSLRTKWPMLIALPLGCTVAPIMALIALVGINWLVQKSDRALYEEIFGQATTISEDRLLTDDFGWWGDREIYMRAEVTPGERRKILATPGLRPSDLTLDQVVLAASEHQFSWWIEPYGFSEFNRCPAARIYEAPGFNDWSDFVVAECTMPPNHTYTQLGGTDFIYIIAK